MTKLRASKTAGAVLVLCAATAIAAHAQTFNSLFNFDGANGDDPLYMSLVQGVDGNLYGTTVAGGPPSAHCEPDGCGNVFKITPDGTLTTLYNFCSQPDCSDGEQPYAGLILGTDGNFYGTTFQGGHGPQCKPNLSYCGTIFRITPQGTLTTLYSFCRRPGCSDGNRPTGALLEGSDGNLYGTTSSGGTYNYGTIFRLAKDGVLTTLHTFCPQTNCIEDGGWPLSGVVQGTDGELYGTTSMGGTYYCGTVFKVTLAGQLTTLHSFDETDGVAPVGGLIQAVGGLFYGTTSKGGNLAWCGGEGCGTVFKITSDGVLTTLNIFNAELGAEPLGTLVQGTDKNFYGTTLYGGNINACNGPCGALFGITENGDYETVHDFNGPQGANPTGGLVQATNGKFYGTTDLYYGTAFTLDMGLGPFVTFVQAYGKIGQIGGILGQGLTGTTAVSFNGISANFTVVSDTFIDATVPPGATGGYVTVTTPSGTLTSNVPFRVIP
jgi:uncharacterized repeat protein (TIGR03803 family)